MATHVVTGGGCRIIPAQTLGDLCSGPLHPPHWLQGGVRGREEGEYSNCPTNASSPRDLETMQAMGGNCLSPGVPASWLLIPLVVPQRPPPDLGRCLGPQRTGQPHHTCCMTPGVLALPASRCEPQEAPPLRAWPAPAKRERSQNLCVHVLQPSTDTRHVKVLCDAKGHSVTLLSPGLSGASKEAPDTVAASWPCPSIIPH